MSIDIATDQLSDVYNIKHKQNTTFTRVFTWRDSNGNLVNLTGYTGIMKVRKTYPATFLVPAHMDAAVVTFSTANGKMALGGVAGTITVVGSPSDMNFAVGLYDYDVLLTSGTNTYTIAEGSFEVRVAVSQ